MVKKYTARRMVRLLPETDKKLVELAAIMELVPAVAIRKIIEATVKIDTDATIERNGKNKAVEVADGE